MAGWATNAGTYSSELTDAKEFPRHQAIARCILHIRRAENAIGLIPVSTADVNEIMDKQA